MSDEKWQWEDKRVRNSNNSEFAARVTCAADGCMHEAHLRIWHDADKAVDGRVKARRALARLLAARACDVDNDGILSCVRDFYYTTEGVGGLKWGVDAKTTAIDPAEAEWYCSSCTSEEQRNTLAKMWSPGHAYEVPWDRARWRTSRLNLAHGGYEWYVVAICMDCRKPTNIQVQATDPKAARQKAAYELTTLDSPCSCWKGEHHLTTKYFAHPVMCSDCGWSRLEHDEKPDLDWMEVKQPSQQLSKGEFQEVTPEINCRSLRLAADKPFTDHLRSIVGSTDQDEDTMKVRDQNGNEHESLRTALENVIEDAGALPDAFEDQLLELNDMLANEESPPTRGDTLARVRQLHTQFAELKRALDTLTVVMSSQATEEAEDQDVSQDELEELRAEIRNAVDRLGERAEILERATDAQQNARDAAAELYRITEALDRGDDQTALEAAQELRQERDRLESKLNVANRRKDRYKRVVHTMLIETGLHQSLGRTIDDVVDNQREHGITPSLRCELKHLGEVLSAAREVVEAAFGEYGLNMQTLRARLRQIRRWFGPADTARRMIAALASLIGADDLVDRMRNDF